MAQQNIDFGTFPDDPDADAIRTAFQKVNANFADLNNSLTVTASNLSSTGEGVFKEKIDADLKFRSLLAGTKMSLTSTADAIIINNTSEDAFTSITTEAGVIVADEASTTNNITIQGGNNIRTTASGKVITIDTILPLEQMLKIYDFGPITGLFDNPIQFSLSSTNIDFGTINIVDSEEQPSSNITLDVGSIV